MQHTAKQRGSRVDVIRRVRNLLTIHVLVEQTEAHVVVRLLLLLSRGLLSRCGCSLGGGGSSSSRSSGEGLGVSEDLLDLKEIVSVKFQ